MKRGDRVDDFVLPDQTGTDRRFSEILAGGPVVLFFYPAAMTPGCTKEACHFRDLAGEFAAVGAQRVGISMDSVDKQAQFADKQRFDYPLLSDADGRIADRFGVKRGLLGKLIPVKRVTFVIDTDATVLDVIASETSMDSHADKALETLRAREVRLMVRIHVERTIAAPPDQVFAWLADPANLTAARLMLKAGWRADAPGPRVGAVRRPSRPGCGSTRRSRPTTRRTATPI